jgi:hypothetical protein
MSRWVCWCRDSVQARDSRSRGIGAVGCTCPSVASHVTRSRSRSELPGIRAELPATTITLRKHDSQHMAPRPRKMSGAGFSRHVQLCHFSVSYVAFTTRRELTVPSFLVIGILVSYLPQHYKIISRRSSRGLSPMFVLLGTVSGTASIANILTLPESTRDMGCCKQIGSFPCAAALLGITQIGVQWTCFFFMYLITRTSS